MVKHFLLTSAIANALAGCVWFNVAYNVEPGEFTGFAISLAMGIIHGVMCGISLATWDDAKERGL